MTQPSPQDDMPPAPWRTKDKFPGTVVDANDNQIALATGVDAEETTAIARAIAAIPGMRAELERRQLIIDAAMAGDIDRLRAENERLEGEISTTMTMRLKAENDRLRAEVARLHERLEDNHWFEQDASGNMVRVECEPGSIPDGISCRDETIKLQDESNDRLRAEKSSLWRMLRLINVRLDGAAVLLKQTCPGEANACVYDVREAIRLLETTSTNETEGK